MDMTSTLTFKVERKEAELLAPAEPTPHEFKYLSDIDDQKGLRFQIPNIQFYRNVVGMERRDPVKVIREAVSKALVFYYPFAGRIREGPNDKLVVECTGEGVLFIEADAHVRLEDFGDIFQPPFPGVDELLYDVPGSDAILHAPLLLIQVTRMLCGGFIFALRMNHTMSDAPGLVQFLRAVGEIARGAQVPSVPPVWNRELLNARDPPQVSCIHHVYQESPETQSMPLPDMDQLAQCCFFFGQQEIARLKNQVPLEILERCSKFDILTACLWRCRVRALSLDFDDEVRVALNVDTRRRFNPPLPAGYYGNAIALPVALSTAGKLSQSPLGYALELVKRAKAYATEEFMRSTADILVKKGRPVFKGIHTYVVSDLTSIGFKDVDVGWGKAVYGGPTRGNQPTSFFLPSKNSRGEPEIAVTINLPRPAMRKFVLEIEKMVSKPKKMKSSFIVSSL